MKKETYRQLLLALIGALMCRFGMGGYYPLLPAYYAAALLRQEGRALLSGVMFLSMALTLPITDTVRYTCGMLVIWAVVKICEWLDHKCLTATAAIAASAVISGSELTLTSAKQTGEKQPAAIVSVITLYSAAHFSADPNTSLRDRHARISSVCRSG